MTLIYWVAGWVAGILAASLFQLPTLVWVALLLLPIGYLLLFWRDLVLRRWHVALIFFVLGALWYQRALPTESDLDLASFNEQGRASLVGIVESAPDVRQTQTLLRVSVSKILFDGAWRETHGFALASIPRDTRVSYGDEVQIDGTPETPPDGDDFSYRDYLARERVFTLIRSARAYTIAPNHGQAFWASMYLFRDAAQSAVNQLLPEPSAALLSGILLGQDQGITPELRKAFNNTNTSHIIAISGFNLGILILVLAFVFRRPVVPLQTRVAPSPSAGRLAPLVTTILILFVLILYTLLVGASASVVRACIMGALVIIALQFGRTNWVYTGMAVAVLLMTLLNPYVLWDVGFQLSFLATLGLVLYAPRLERWIESGLLRHTTETRARHIVNLLRDAFIVTAAACVVTAPLIVLYFHRVSLVGFLTNFLVLPMQPAIMMLGGAGTLLQMLANVSSPIPFVGLILGALAQVLAWGAYIFLQYTILVVQATASIPFGSFEVARIDAPLVILFYAALFGVTYLGFRRTGQLLLSRMWMAIALVALATMFVWTTAVASPDPRSHISFITASQGDATFIRTGEDYRILINGTGEPNTLLSFLGNQFPPWDRRLDLVIATHMDDSNLSSLNAVLERYWVGRIVEPPKPSGPGISYEKWQELIGKNGVEVVPAQAGTSLRAGDVRFDLVYPSVDSDAPYAALRMETNGHSFLIAPALAKPERRELLNSDAVLEADVAVLPNEFEPEFLKRVGPSQVILFVERRPSEKPTAEMLKLLERVMVLRTDERGTLNFVLDENGVDVRVEK